MTAKLILKKLFADSLDRVIEITTKSGQHHIISSKEVERMLVEVASPMEQSLVAELIGVLSDKDIDKFIDTMALCYCEEQEAGGAHYS